MSFRICPDEPVGGAIRRIALEQLDKAFCELDAGTDGDLESLHGAVHDVRKRMKKLRGLLRLVRDAAPDLYRCENAELRDAARRISSLRDAKALLETIDELAECETSETEETALEAIRKVLDERCRLASDGESVQLELQAVRDALHRVNRRAHRWHLDDLSWNDVIEGAARTYGRGRKAEKVARDDDVSPEQLHEWRKRAKYGRYHQKLLRELWPKVVKHRYETIKELSSLLGDHHDLEVLGVAVEQLAPAPQHREAIEGLIARRSDELLAAARLLGRKLYVEKKKHWHKRFGVYAEVAPDQVERCAQNA